MSLRSVIVGILLSLITSGCNIIPEESILNYKNSIVIEKPISKTMKGDTITYSYYIRYKEGSDKYHLKIVIVPKFEYYLFDVGDTIE